MTPQLQADYIIVFYNSNLLIILNYYYRPEKISIIETARKISKKSTVLSALASISHLLWEWAGCNTSKLVLHQPLPQHYATQSPVKPRKLWYCKASLSSCEVSLAQEFPYTCIAIMKRRLRISCFWSNSQYLTFTMTYRRWQPHDACFNKKILPLALPVNNWVTNSTKQRRKKPSLAPPDQKTNSLQKYFQLPLLTGKPLHPILLKLSSWKGARGNIQNPADERHWILPWSSDIQHWQSRWWQVLDQFASKF